jgi:hypothetical protein
VEFQENHLRSSNLGHYAGIVLAAVRMSSVSHVLQPFSMPGRADSMVVDVVAAHGKMWIKVIARKAQALHLIWAGKSFFGHCQESASTIEYKSLFVHDRESVI